MSATSTNLLTALNAGSGIDTRKLVGELVNAEKAPRQAVIDQRLEKAEAKISALSTFRSSISALSSALSARTASGVLSGQPGVSDPSVLGFTLPGGGTVPRQSIEVRQLARGQSLSSAPLADTASPVGEGSLTIRFGQVAGTAAATGFAAGPRADLNVTIGPEANSLAGLKDAINNAAALAKAPVQAVILTDAAGSRLLLRGQMGEESAFVVDSTLEAFAFRADGSGGLSRTQVAQDARVAIDGVEIRRPANIITDLVANASLTLYKAAPGAPVTIEAARDTAELKQVVTDMAAALNELVAVGKSLSSAASSTASAGALAADSSTRRALIDLKQLVSQDLLERGGGQPTRLSDIGLTLDRHGSFIIDSARLSAAAETHPEAIEALVNAVNAARTASRPAGPLKQIAENFSAAVQGAGGQPTALQQEKTQIAADQRKLDDRIERMTRNYTRQFAAVDSRVGQYKELMTFMQQQIDMWTKSR